MLLIKKNQLINQPIHEYTNKQKNLLGWSLFISAIGFTLIAAIGFGFYYALINNIISDDTLYIISAISLFASLFSMIIYSFGQPSITKIIFIYIIYIFGTSVGFSSLFLVFKISQLLMIFTIAALTFLLSGIFAFLLPSKIIGSLIRFSFMMFIFATLLCLIFSLVSILSFNSYYDNWWTIILVILSSLFSVLYSIYIFHSISKMNEFYIELNKQQLILITLNYGFILLVSFIQLIWSIVYIYLWLK